MEVAGAVPVEGQADQVAHGVPWAAAAVAVAVAVAPVLKALSGVPAGRLAVDGSRRSSGVKSLTRWKRRRLAVYACARAVDKPSVCVAALR